MTKILKMRNRRTRRRSVWIVLGFITAGTLAFNEQRGSVPLGFTRESFASERRWEQQLMNAVDAQRCRSHLRKLTSEPHVAGTPGDQRVSNYIAEEFRRDGLETEVVPYNVLLSYPKQVSVELVAPVVAHLANPEPPIEGDPDTQVSDPIAHMPWNGYSPSADITQPVVYVNYGRAEDYDRLERLGVSVKGRIVLARYFQGYRGGKSLEAEKRGAAAVIMYSDPAEDGAAKGKVYPDGPWGPAGHFQRGAVVYDFIVPGDPLTPGWASTDGARRIPESEAKILPKIPMVPLSAADAKNILAVIGGPEAPKEWQGGLRQAVGGYRVGDGSARVHLRLDMENRVTPIWDVIGRIRGQRGAGKIGGALKPSRRMGVWGGGSGERDSDDARACARVRRNEAIGIPAAPHDRFRQLGCRRIHSNRIDRVGRGARARAAKERNRVPERGCGDKWK